MSERHCIGILVGPKGRGSNMRAILNACLDGRIQSDALVISPSLQTPAAEWATSSGIPLVCLAPGEGYEQQLIDALEPCDLVCLAGYLRLLPSGVLAAHPHAVLNIHPALLPEFGGKGMYGLRVHEAVLASGSRESGCTVHYVTEQYDEGEILVQRRCPVEADDTPETLAARVLELEHATYVEAVQRHFVMTGESIHGK